MANFFFYFLVACCTMSYLYSMTILLNRHKCIAGFRLACSSLHCRFIAWSLPVVSELQLSVACCFGFSTSDIALKLSRSQLSEVCCCGQSSQIIVWLAWRFSPLCLSSVASGTCAEKSPSKWQFGEWTAGLKAAYGSNFWGRGAFDEAKIMEKWLWTHTTK